MRISPTLLAVVLGASLAQPVFAKEHQSVHAKGTAGSAAAKGAFRKGPRTGTHAPAAAGVGAKGEDAKSPPEEAPIVNAPAVSKGPDASAGVKLKATPVPQLHGAPVTAPANTVLRNAIGLPVVRHDAVPGSGPHLANAPPAAGFSPAARVASPGAGPGAPAGHQNPNIGLAPRGSISGTGMSRSPVAPATLGGPAKVAAGINGSTLRPKP